LVLYFLDFFELVVLVDRTGNYFGNKVDDFALLLAFKNSI